MAALTEQQINDRIEIILDRIAETLIQNTSVSPELVRQNQKTIRDGIISVGRTNLDNTLILYQTDVEANQQDLDYTDENGTNTLRYIVEHVEDVNQIQITVEGTNVYASYSMDGENNPTFDLTPLLTQTSLNEDGTQTIINPLNISQFLNIEKKSTSINVEQANEFLDTNIYELLPDQISRQEQINNLFNDINELLPPPIPDEQWGLDDNGRVNRSEDTDDWVGSQDYYLDTSISAEQNNESGAVQEEFSFITRLQENESEQNSSKSIEALRNRLNTYLKDVDDERPEYKNQSNGFLKFRNLNQGIIIRNTDEQFINGLNPETRDYLQTGFTITMWVKFLDKTSQGTLFNFGNPTRAENPFGFKLETFVVNGNDLPTVGDFIETSEGSYLTGFNSNNHTWKEIFQNGNPAALTYDASPPNENFFETTDTERFIRLVVRDEGGVLRGSHLGTNFMDRRDGVPEFGYYDDQSDYDHAYGLMTNVRIPADFTEWYFICATFNPSIQEDASHQSGVYDVGDYKNNPGFWRNNINPINGSPIVNSTYGNKCKVEIISRSDLLRARGFKG